MRNRWRVLFRIVRIAEALVSKKIVSSVMTQLTWIHLIRLFSFDDQIDRIYNGKSTTPNR